MLKPKTRGGHTVPEGGHRPPVPPAGSGVRSTAALAPTVDGTEDVELSPSMLAYPNHLSRVSTVEAVGSPVEAVPLPVADDATKEDLAAPDEPALPLRAVLAHSANSAVFPAAEHLQRALRHLDEFGAALPDAIEASTGELNAGLKALRNLLF